MHRFCPGCGILSSSVLIIIGLFFLFVFPSIEQFFAAKELSLNPKSKSFRHWQSTPVPVSMDFYLFNWTNPEDIESAKPKFTELGPYRFYENRVKVDLVWNSNGTISYRQKRSWHFRADESNGSLEDLITTINPVSLTAAYSLRHADIVDRLKLDAALNFIFNEKISVTKTVRELLFEGYTDNMMQAAYKYPYLSPIHSPSEQFAWFHNRNDSFTFDGWFNLDTGALDLSGRGRVKSWNHKNHTGFYPGECGAVSGFSGDVFPPKFVRKDTPLKLFSQDICRSLPLHYKEDEEVRGISGYKYHTRLREKDNGTYNPDDSCFCNGECVPSGFMNLTTCRYGAPVFVSLPHFYDADPTYLSIVDGLQPDQQKHEFSVTIEPTYGIPIDVSARVQLNMLLQPIDNIYIYKRVSRIMMPVLWVDQRAVITEPLAQELWLVILLPFVATTAGVLALSLGIMLFAVSLICRAKRRLAEQNLVKQIEIISSLSAPKRSLTLTTQSCR